MCSFFEMYDFKCFILQLLYPFKKKIKIQQNTLINPHFILANFFFNIFQTLRTTSWVPSNLYNWIAFSFSVVQRISKQLTLIYFFLDSFQLIFLYLVLPDNVSTLMRRALSTIALSRNKTAQFLFWRVVLLPIIVPRDDYS